MAKKNSPSGPKKDPSDRVHELRVVIHEHDYNYHVLDRPLISDFEYDKLFRELQSLRLPTRI